jgi:glycerol uptake facilitator-like aquaporin
MFGKRNVATLVAEFLGTGILTLLVLSVQRSTIGVPFFIAMAAGLTLALLTFVFNATSGAFFNPAITLAMWTARRLATVRALLYVAAQLLGAWAAYYLYTYYTKNSFQSIGGVFNGRVLVAEAVATGIFALGWAAAFYQGFSTATRAAVSGLAYMMGIIAASSAAIGLLNPAVALGARAWVWGTYVLGPVLGAIIGLNLFGLLFATPEGGVVAAASTSRAVKTPARTTTRKVAAKKPAAKRSTAKRRTTRK